MVESKFEKIRKRNGIVVDFEESKIKKAVFKALTASQEGDGDLSEKVTDRVMSLLNKRKEEDETPTVEEIQDLVEEVLILEGLTKAAKAYILYREKRRGIREAAKATQEATEKIDDYLNRDDWEVKENANMAFSLQGMNRYVISKAVKKYWLNKIYTEKMREANENGSFHIHDLDTLGPYSFFGKETLIVKIDSQIKLLSFEQLYEEISCEEEVLNKKDRAYVKHPENLEVLDRKGWTNVFRLVKKKKERDMNFIKSEQGRSVTVTDNHPFIVKNSKEDDEKEIEASSVKEKEHFISSYNIPSLLENEKLFSKDYIYVAEELVKNDYSDFFLEGFQVNEFIDDWNGSLKSEGSISTSNNANSLDNKLKLTEDLGYLLGIFIAEGNYDSWRLAITNSNEKIIKRIRKICSSMGVRTHIKEKGSGSKRMIISSSTLKLVFEKVFKIKSLSRYKNLPLNILEYNRDFAKGLVAGVIDGDGSVKSSETQISIRLSSRTLLEQIASLLQFFGIIVRDRSNIGSIGTVHKIKEKEVVQNYPIYGIAFSKRKKLELPSFKFKKVEVAKSKWRADEYDWNKVLDNEKTAIPDDVVYDITTESRTFLCNGLLVHNCVGWDLYDFLMKGFGGVSGKVASKPPKHFKSALGQVVNFMYTVQGEAAGAIAFSNFDTLLAPFIRYDNLSYSEVKQAMQEFMFNMSVPTRTGFQCPFTNVTLDLQPPKNFKDKPVIIGGESQDENYGDFQEEMNKLNRAFYEVMMEGDKNGRVFTFPIPTINITDDFDWDDPALEPMWEATVKYGVNYFANYMNSDMNPDDARSMCCRLRLSKKELHNRGGGGLFGSGALTGSIGVVTINLPQLGYLSDDKEEFYERLDKLMDTARDSLKIKRKCVDDFTEKGLYPYSKHYLQGIKSKRDSYWANHFSTIGVIGMNECLLNFIDKNLTTDEGQELSIEIMDHIRERILDYQEETGNLYNLEASPAEGTAYRLAKKDKENYPDIITAGSEDNPYYTNSTQLPVGFTDDAFEALDLQDELQCKYTGGTVKHLFLGEKVSDTESAKKFIKKVFSNYNLPYISLTPTFSVCPNHGYLSGEHETCPKCTVEQKCEVYSRIVGYLRPVSQWNEGKSQEFEEREEYEEPEWK